MRPLGEFAAQDAKTRSFMSGVMSRFFRSDAKVLAAKALDPLVRATVLENGDGTMTAVMVNLGPKRVVSVAGWDSFPRLPRLYLYDSAKPYANRFGDLPQPDRTVAPAGGELRIEIPEKGLAFVTTDYVDRMPPPVKGMRRTGERLSWIATDDPDHRYYRVYANGRQVASTVATSCAVDDVCAEYFVASVDRWENVGDVVVGKDVAVTDEKPLLFVPCRTAPVDCTTFARDLGFGRLDVAVDGTNVFSFTVDATGGTVAWHSPIDLARYAGKKVRLSLHGVNQFGDAPFAGFRMGTADELPKDVYDEPYRPQLTLTPKWGWSNDPNGFSYYRGRWHVFYQSVPCSTVWRPSNGWRHAVSDDLVHWTEIAPALEADAQAAAWSGSAVTDDEGRHVLFYTRHEWTGRHLQAVARSTDGVAYAKGETVLGEVIPGCRDPFVFRHRSTGDWTMLLYFETNQTHAVGVFTSKDMRDWTRTSTIFGDPVRETSEQPRRFLGECPFAAEVPVEGTGERRWLVAGGSLAYQVGDFDGKVFTPCQEPMAAQATWIGAPGTLAHFLPYYAGQVCNDAPGGRVVYLPWYKLPTPSGSRFSQSLGLPLELTLVKRPEGFRLRMRPVKELEALRDGAATGFAAFRGELAEIEYAAVVGKDARVAFDLRGHALVYDAVTETLSSGANVKVPWKVPDGRLALRLYVDRRGLQVFSQDGFQVLPDPTAAPDRSRADLSVRTAGTVSEISVRVWKLTGIWNPRSVRHVSSCVGG